MNKRTLIILTLLAITTYIPAQAEGPLSSILQSIERNNLTLKSQSGQNEARNLEARTGNSLGNTNLSFDRLWGSPIETGKSAEFNVSQEFDFPSAYINRNKLAEHKSQQYDDEYNVLRQQILLEAKETYIELQMLYQMEQIMECRACGTGKLVDLYKNKYESGDATILEKNRVEYEFLQMQETVTSYKIRIASLESRLVNLNGGEPLELIPVTLPMESVTDYERLLNDYETADPRILTYQSRKTVSEQEVKVSRSAALPKFEVGYKREQGIGDRFNGITVGMSLPIFSNRNNVKRAKALQYAAEAELNSAINDNRSTLKELYDKANLLSQALEKFETLPTSDEYVDLLTESIQAGEISIVDYFSELYAYYDIIETKLRTEMEYRLTIAKLHMIYL